MNERLRNRPTKWDTKAMRKRKRLSKADIVALTKEYERRAKKEHREEVLFDMSEKYERSPRQLERYIQQGRQEIQAK
jgi:hypothetical protein